LLGRLPLLHQAPVVSLLSAFGRRWLPLPAAPFSQTSLPSPGPKVSVGPRFECLQTKRCAYFGMHATPAPFFTLSSRGCTTYRFRVNTTPVRCPLAVPPPHFDLLVHSRGCLVWSELPLRTHSSRSFSSGRIFRFAVFSRSSRLWAVLRSGCNPLALSRQFTLSRGVCQAPHSEMPPRSQRPRSHPIGSAFLTISGEVHLNPYGSPSGYGPGLTRGKTPHISLVSDATLCSFCAATAASA